MIKRELAQKILLGMVLCLTVFPVSISARSSSEIADDIRRQQEELARTQQNLNQARNNINLYSNAITGTAGSLPDLENQIKQLEAEIEANNYELDLNRQMKLLKELEKESREIKQNSTLKSIYMDWRIESATSVKEVLHSFDFKKYEQYTSFLTNTQQENIFLISSELNDLNNEIKDYEIKLEELNKKNEELATKKKQLEEQILFYNSMLAYNSGQIGNLSGQMQNIQSNISSLSNEQRIALQRESELNNQSGNNPSISGCLTTDSTNGGNFYFCGLGRDAYQGHGVGLSQWGSHGMGQKGILADDIIKFYYKGVSVTGGYENRTVNVTGYGTLNIEDYAAGIAEIPSKACGNADQVAARPDKYAIFNGNIWSCWPEETIKSKVIIARTYALFHGSVCTTAACQVYDGSNSKRWAVEETKGKVILFNGNFIDAVYSSDNNQGFGTANNDTIWQGYNGIGTPYAYLRSVNDSSLATSTSWTNWGYKSNTYSLSKITEMLDYIGANPAGYPWINPLLSSYAVSAKNSIGNVISISFERDPSKRVKRVLITGSNGQFYIGGYWFKYMWNEWVYYYNIRNSQQDRLDYLYSQTFFIHN